MPVEVLEAEDADMGRIFQIASLAFADNEPLWDIMWPKHWEEGGRKQGADRMRGIRNTDQHTKYMKAVDSESGAIMGMAKWNVYAHNTLPDMGNIKHIINYWNDDEEVAYATAMTNIFLQERNAAIRESGGNLVSLDILAIDPQYQRRGVGSELVKYGTRKADELGVEAVVESSVFGKGLYEKHGYVFVKDVVIRVPETTDGSGRKEGRFAWLVRPKKQS